MKTFEEIMQKREELMNECRLEGVATLNHSLHGVYGMLWGVGHESAPGMPQPSKVGDLLWAADVIYHQWPSVSKLFDYKDHKELYKKCYGWIRDLSRVAHGLISWEDLKW